MSEPARARLLWAILSSVPPVTLGHTTSCHSRAQTFFSSIHFAIKRPIMLRYSPPSWAAVGHWSTLIQNVLRSSRKHPIHSFSWTLTLPASPTSHALRQSPSLHARLKSRQNDPPRAHEHLNALTFRRDKHDYFFANRCSKSRSCGGVGTVSRSSTRAGSTLRSRTALSRVPRFLASGC